MEEEALWKRTVTKRSFIKNAIIAIVLFVAFFIGGWFGPFQEGSYLVVCILPVLLFTLFLVYLGSSKNLFGGQCTEVKLFKKGFEINGLFYGYTEKNAAIVHYPAIRGEGAWQLELTNRVGTVVKIEVTEQIETLKEIIRDNKLQTKIKFEEVKYTLGEDKRERT